MTDPKQTTKYKTRTTMQNTTENNVILVTGANGAVGRHVVDQLVKRGANVRALVRDISKANFPEGVTVAKVICLTLTRCMKLLEEYPPCSCSTRLFQTSSPRR